MAYNSAMNIKEDESYEVQTSALFKFLQLAGFEGRFPRAAVFASVLLGGLGMWHIYTE
jgi:hypothetical protein